MKKTLIIIISSLLLFWLWIRETFAGRVDSTLIGTSVWENAWNVIFNQDPDPASRWVWAYMWLNNQLYWSFWIENVWWVSFDHWVVWQEAKYNSTNWAMTWFAWSENAGWIAFNDSSTPWPNVTYDINTWLFHWFAWSENLWWISMEWIRLDITEPALINFKAFAADHNKTFNIVDSWSIWSWFSTSVEKWYTSAQLMYYWQSFVHDFRNAKPYNIVITDPSGNTSNWIITVVANIPTTTFDNSHNIWVWSTATVFSWSIGNSNMIADWLNIHYFNISLRDTYWNIIKPEPWIKSVSVEVSFSGNNVDFNQINNATLNWIWNLDLGDAIYYDALDFSLISWMVWNIWSWYKSNWNYYVGIKSYAPTKSAYVYTTDNNDIKLQSLKVNVSWISWNSWIWETTNYDPVWFPYKNKINFLPAIEVSTTDTDPANWQALFDSWITFNSTITKHTTENIPSFQSAYILDIDGMNNLMSFQDLSSTNGNSDCIWFNNTSNKYQTSWTSWCDRNLFGTSIWVSNILFSSIIPWNTSTQSFKAKPKMVSILLPSFPFTFSSEIKYKIGSSSDFVAFPSYVHNTSSTEWVTNNEIRITGIINNSSKSNVKIMSGSTLSNQIVWNLTKNDIKTNISKNIESIVKWWRSWDPKILYISNSDYNISSLDPSKNTVIIKWWDIIIDQDLLKNNWNLNGIVVLKWSNWKWGNIWIDNNVTKIEAVIYCEWNLISWEKWTPTYYSDTNNWATKQLMIFWSVISSNTIWWASSNPPKCPYWIVWSCDDQIAKRYDFNHFRHFNPNISPNPDLIYPKYPRAPLIIEYDTAIQTNPLKVFKMYN